MDTSSFTWNTQLDSLCRYVINVIDNIRLPPNPVVVFDIDGTLLSTKNYTVIPQMRDLYQYIRNKGIDTFIITARPNYPINILSTENTLRTSGITDYIATYYMYDKIPPDRYKLEARKHIRELGYNVIMSIGDQEHDTGLYGGIPIIVPSEEN